jgi:hypothetical protein
MASVPVPGTDMVCTGFNAGFEGCNSTTDAVVLLTLAAATTTARLPAVNGASVLGASFSAILAA